MSFRNKSHIAISFHFRNLNRLVVSFYLIEIKTYDFLAPNSLNKYEVINEISEIKIKCANQNYFVHFTIIFN